MAAPFWADPLSVSIPCPAQDSRLWGSNPRPYAYEAHALPTELRRQLRLVMGGPNQIIVWGRVTSCYNDSRESSCSLPRLNHVTIRPPQYVMRASMLFMATYPVRSVLSDDHVSADMRTPFFHTVSSAICLRDLHDQTDISWAHGVVVSHPLRMRKAQSQCVHAYVHA